MVLKWKELTKLKGVQKDRQLSLLPSPGIVLNRVKTANNLLF
jgi:hypothetical protein